MPRPKKVKRPDHWHKFEVKQREDDGNWIAVFPHPTRTRRRNKNGRVYHEPREVERVLKHVDQRPPADKADAYALGELVYQKLEVDRIRAREHGPEKEETLDGTRLRWPILAGIKDWLDSYKSAKTRTTNNHRIDVFREWIKKPKKEENRREFVDQLTVDDGRTFHARVAGLDVSDRMKHWHWQSVGTFLKWMVKKARLDENPFARGNHDSFISQKPRDRTLAKSIPVVHRAERDGLLSACNGPKERAWFQLYNLLGLRPAEPCYLRWRDFKTHTNPPQLALLHIPERNYYVKTGERLVAIVYPEVLEVLLEWRAVSPYGTAPDDWIFARAPRTPYEEAPREWIERLQATGTHWTPTIGRHTACSIFPFNSERLTGRRWTEIEHKQFFGHSFETAQQYYITENLIDLAELEKKPQSGRETPRGVAGRHQTDAALDIALAKKLLRHLLTSAGATVSGVATDLGVTEAAVRKWLRQGKRMPTWFWQGVRGLLSK